MIVLGDEGFDLFAAEGGEYLNIAFRIVVTHVHPELEELIRAGVFLREPNVAGLGLAELTTVGFGDQRAGEGESGLAVHLAHQLDTGGDVTPLIRTSHLHQAVLMLIQIDEIVALEELVGELGEGHTLRELAVETFLDGVLRHHIIDGDEFADIAREINKGVVLHPVVVVDQLGCVGRVAVEIEEMLQLLADTCHVVAKYLFGEQVTLGRFAGRVTNHTCCAADEGDGFVTARL